MMFESCSEIRERFSEFLDGVLDPATVRSLRFHLGHCVACRRELDQWQSAQTELRQLPRRQAPADLSLRLRVRMSQELHRNLLERWMVRLENALRPVLLPSLAGVLVAIICVGLMMGAGVPPVSNIPDVPLDLVTPPRVRELAPMTFNTGDQPVVVVTYVNADGRVTSYRVLSGQHSPKLMEQLDQMMYFSLFQPATTFGRPTSGEVVLSLRRITVRG